MKKHKFLLLNLLLGFVLFGVQSALAQGISDPDTQPVTTFLLVDFVDNFENGVNAGGVLKVFGNENVRDDSADTTAESSGRMGTDTAFRLKTAATGFGLAADGENFVGFSKDINDILLSDGSQAKIDASSFNALSYFFKPVSSFAGTEIEVGIQLVIGDGGDTTPANTTDSFTGSTWTQTDGVRLAGITNPGNNNGFTRVVTNLIGSVAGETAGFQRVVGPTVGTDQETLNSTLLADISAVNIVLSTNNDGTDVASVAREILVDDINFFENLTVELAVVNSVFAKSGSGFVFDLLATAKQSGALANNINLTVTTTGAGTLALPNGGETGVGGNPTGQVAIQYTVSSIAEIAEIKVEVQ